MIATSKIEMDLNWYSRPKIEAIQDDKYSRNVEISLTTDGTPWEIPDGVAVAVNYIKADGTGGEYDTMPNGEMAWSASGNVLTVKLAPQVLTVAGSVLLVVMLFSGEAKISTFAITVNVHRVPDFSASSEDYVNMRKWLVSELNKALTAAKESGEFNGPAGRGVSAITGNEDGSWTITYTDGTKETISNEAYAAITLLLNQLSLEIAGKEQVSPEFANSIAECTDTSKLYVLPDGYIYAYMSTTETAYTNQIRQSINSDGTEYVGENGEDGYKSNYRLNSSGAEAAQSGVSVTGFIPVEDGDILYFKDVPFTPNGGSSYDYIALYNSSFELIIAARASEIDNIYYLVGSYTVDEATGYMTSATLADKYGTSDIAYIRISATGLDGSATITVNEEITDDEVVTYSWTNTGHAFVPADYEDRIIKAETDIATIRQAITGDMAVYGIVDSENNIIMTGTLESGTYTLKYMAEDGTTTDIGEFTME